MRTPITDGLARRSWIAAVALTLAACAGPQAPPERGDTAPRRIGNLEVRGVPDIAPELSARLQQYRNTRAARLQGWLGDGVLIATRFGDTSQLHRVAQPLGMRRQLTFFREPVAEAVVAAQDNADGFVYLRDAGGSENYQLFHYDLASGTSSLRSDGRSRYTGVVWANGGERFAYTTTERNGRDWDIHLQTVTGETRTILEAGGTGWMVEDFAPDDTHLLVSRYVSINESKLYELSLTDGSLTPLIDEDRRAAIRQAAYAPDGERVFFTADLGAEFLRLHELDRRTGRIRVLTGDIAWDVEAFAVAPQGEHLAFTVNEGGYSRLYVWQMPTRTRVALPALPAGIISELMFHPDGDRLGFSLAQPTAPRDVYSVHLRERSLARWTRSETGGLDPDGFVTPELIAYPTFDTVNGAQRRIPAFVYRPAGPGPHPVYVTIHGGPESQYRPYFSAALQYYVKELGMAVVAPNVRGSAGYGKSYLQLDNAERREDSVRDIGALLDWVAATADLDADRVVVSGGSYGGYMVLASLVQYSDRLIAGVERVGISNFVTFLTNTEDYRRNLRRAEYGDERDPRMREYLEQISPLNNVERIRRPLLITQGANDPRVPAGESEQIYQALQRNGVPVWYVLALDEGHGFRKKANSDYAAAATVAFLQRFALSGQH
ncbi:MAG: S9 family peptidase [Gammaproteobacteria bacterium]|nr:S9 family peptidase [Gammaproteobacteria bacterium]